MLTCPHHNQALFLQRAQQTADIGRIKPEPLPEISNEGSFFSNLPQEPCLAKRMVSAQEVVV
jgi:hypothetical protein